MTDPVIAVTVHCPGCGERLAGTTFVTNVAVYLTGVTVDLDKVRINHECRSPQDKQ